MERISISRIIALALAVVPVSAVPTSLSQSGIHERTTEGTRDSFGREYQDYQLSSGQAHPSTPVSQRDEPRVVSTLDLSPHADSLADGPSPSHLTPTRKHSGSGSLQHPISLGDVTSSCFRIRGYSSAAPHINGRHLRLTMDSKPSFKTPRYNDSPATTFHISHDGALTAFPSGDVLVAPSHPSGGEWATFVSRELAEKDPQWYPLAVCRDDAPKHRLECSHPHARIEADSDVDLEPLSLSVLRTDYCSFSGENGSVQDYEDEDTSDTFHGNECSVAWWPMWGSPGWEEDADFRTISLSMEETTCTL